MKTIRTTLKTGDYSIEGLEDYISVERKSFDDFYSTLATGRDRFKREMERMRDDVTHPHVVIEGDWNAIKKGHPRTKFNPVAAMHTILSWSMRFGVHFWTFPDRRFAEAGTFRLLEHAWKHKQEKK